MSLGLKHPNLPDSSSKYYIYLYEYMFIHFSHLIHLWSIIYIFGFSQFSSQVLAHLVAFVYAAIACRRNTVPWNYWQWPMWYAWSKPNMWRMSEIFYVKFDIHLWSVCKYNKSMKIFKWKSSIWVFINDCLIVWA